MTRIRFLYTFLLLLAVQLAVAQQYEYWLDNDYAQRKTVNGNVPETITTDVSQLPVGLHYFNFRARAAGGQWGALSRYMVYLADNGTGNISMTGYEYWLDNDYEHRKVVESNSGPGAITLDVSQLPVGLHYFNFRTKTVSGQWGGLSRYMVYLADNGTGSISMTGYEYWLDNDYAQRKVVAGNSVPEAITIDVSQLPVGLHYFNFRAKTVSGQWGGLSRYMVYLADNGTGSISMTGYEYWLDNDYEHRKVVESNSGPGAITMDISKLSPGLHYFNFRAKTVSGQWGALSRYMVYLVDNGVGGTSVADCEYWLDNDYANRTILGSGIVPTAITAEIGPLSPGLHYFNFRAKSISGQWGALSRYMFYIYNRTAADIQVKRLEYWIDEDVEHRVAQDVAADSVVVTVDLKNLAAGTHTFTVHCLAENGEWSMPESYEFTIGDLPTVPTPVITHEGNIVTISDGDGADHDTPITYHYTLDGTTPSDSSMLYEAPIEVTRNLTLKAVGYQTGHNRSAVATLTVDWFKVATPTFEQDGNRLTISCETDSATIYYTIGGGEEQVYSEPLTLTEQQTVTAVGRRDGYNDSETAVYQPWQVKSAMPEVSYNGRFVQLSSSEDGAAIYYTLDGTLPVEGQAILYDGEFVVERLCLLKAVAVVDSLNPSDVAEYSIDYLYDGETAYVRQGNLLEKAFEWCGGLGEVERLTVEVPLSDADMAVLKNAPAMTHLDLGKTTLTSGRMPDGAFSGTGLVSFVSPNGFNEAGSQLFANCPRLAAVVWNADTALPANALDGVDNPNLLLYVNSANYAPSSVTNVVVNGIAESIVLTDRDTGNNDFYCPQAFTATTVSYAHNFQMQTGIGVCRGWESIALPFTVQTITHERNGQLQPFMADGDGKPFWLLQMSSAGLEPATEIKANQPYVIAMPNNAVYPDAYNQAGRVTFAASQAAIVPSELSGVEGQGVVLVPALRRVSQSADVFAINRNVPYESYVEGSIFVADYREVRPFEAYTLHPAGGSRLIALSDLMSDSATGLVAIPIEEAADGTVRVYSLSGVLVATGERSEVMKRLPKGVYIINGKKMVVK